MNQNYPEIFVIFLHFKSSYFCLYFHDFGVPKLVDWFDNLCNLTLSMLRKCICFTVCLTQTLLPVFTHHRCIFHPVICFNSHLQKRYYFPFQSEFAFNTFNMFKERYHFKNFPTDMKANGMKLIQMICFLRLGNPI